MLTPTVANKIGFFYAAGNTPATSLTRCVPQGQDATILSLGCGDLRNILYTAYTEKGLPSRKLDFTCCDYDDKIVARNVFLLSFLLDGDCKLSSDKLWDVYYHLFVDGETAAAVLHQATKLVSMSKNLEDWNKNIYGRAIKFCDADTLRDARRAWVVIKDAAEKCHAGTYWKAFEENVQPSRDCRDGMLGEQGINITAMRSAAPLSLQAGPKLWEMSQQYWKDGTVTPKGADENTPNPLLASLLSEDQLLHYGTDPILGFHLATGYAPLTESSPLKPQNPVEGFPATAAARTQFNEWIAAFKSDFRKNVVIRFAISDTLTLCHSLQTAAATGKSANLYRRVWDARPLILDAKEYGKAGSGAKTFDMIDTSNLSDHIGALNLLIAAGPLLKDEPWASLFTELLIKRQGTLQNAFEQLICGHAPTISLLLGFSPVQYWTNAKAESHVDEVFLGLMNKGAQRDTQVRSRLAWKRDTQFSGQVRHGKLHIEAKQLVKLLSPLYDYMFEAENVSKALENVQSQISTYTHFIRTSFAAFIKVVMNRVATDWPTMCSTLVDTIAQDHRFYLASNGMQDLCLQLHLHGVNTEPWMLQENRKLPENGTFNLWKSLPPAVAVTVVVPRSQIARLYKHDNEQLRLASPPLVGSVRSSHDATEAWQNIFGDIHIVFGNLKTSKLPNEDDFQITVEPDKDGWAGDSALIASFYVPTSTLQNEPNTALAGVCVPPTGQNSVIFGPILGMNMTVFETQLDDRSQVFVTKYLPGQTGYPLICGGLKPLDKETNPGQNDKTTKLMVDVAPSESKITTITGHLDITSTKAKALLKEKVPIELRQENPFVIDIVFGQNKLVCPVKFPVPVTKTGIRSRVARTTGYIEVIAPLAEPAVSEELFNLVYPVEISSSGVPATLNTPHFNLDNLPIIDLRNKEKTRWMTTLTSLQFSTREKHLREVRDDSGISDNPVVNLKESIFTMFMLASGLQGGQTGLFAISHPDRGGIHMLVFVSAIRLDGDAASVVLDAAIIPFTMDLVESGRMEAFLLILRTLECASITVNDAELALWKNVLPSFVERCRTWPHGRKCEYKRKGATIPLSLEDGEQVICSCGNGRLPKDFMSLPEWDSAAPNAVRVAISPTYAVPFVEEVIDASEMPSMEQVTSPKERCRNCGKPESDSVTLKKCMRCQRAKYCSGECQKKDWKKHRGECDES
ncbi:hypothetical protein LCI18_000394 [Fusarium solani-melongenae]|uniref:Uncharacterized protein n=1 Tax=Fusarium solani subsp. cucurbitae TaxID=2747967 RepID=A0ACD3YKI0_FUSSC|nr:hypothetical protein LCI18_000394 [Fusarium solani-melongenae]